MPTEAALVVAASKSGVPQHLNTEIVRAWKEATKTKANFTIALSGGSLPSFLSTLPDIFKEVGEDPKFDSWHVLLAVGVASRVCVDRTWRLTLVSFGVGRAVRSVNRS